MGDALGAASSILALTVFAFDTSKTVYDAIRSFKSQRKIIVELQTDLEALTTVLDVIRQQAQRLENDRSYETLREPLEHCTAVCQEMNEMINICNRHAKDHRESVRDWLRMQYREKSIDDLKLRLASYKSTLSITFDSINVQEHLKTQDSLTELKQSIEGTKDDLEDQLSRVERAISGIEIPQDSLLTDREQLQSALSSLAQAQARVQTIRPQIEIKDNRAGEYSRTLFGTDTSRPDFNLTISNNEAQRGAVMGSGVHSPETLHALLQGSRAAELMPMIQELQIRNSNLHTDRLASLLSNNASGPPQRTIYESQATIATDQAYTTTNVESQSTQKSHGADKVD